MSEVHDRAATDFFGSYLDALKRLNDESDNSLRILLQTVSANHPVPMTDLQPATGLAMVDFVRVFEAARALGWIDVLGPSGQEQIDLSDTGAEVLPRLERAS